MDCSFQSSFSDYGREAQSQNTQHHAEITVTPPPQKLILFTHSSLSNSHILEKVQVCWGRGGL